MSMRRLAKERQQLTEHADDYEIDNGIFTSATWDFDQASDDLSELKVMIVCRADDSPYFGGYFFFDVSIPQDYPFKPPKVIFRTGDNRARLHPNLYTVGRTLTKGAKRHTNDEGKVCLSMLGTWPYGQPWSPALTLGKVFIVLSSLLGTGRALTNEPGYEDASEAATYLEEDFEAKAAELETKQMNEKGKLVDNLMRLKSD